MDKRVFVLGSRADRRKAVAFVSEALEGTVVSVGQPVRNGAQSALLHATLGEIADRVQWAGKPRSIECWKRLLVASWLRAEGESIEVLPALDGHGIDLVYQPTSTLSKAQMSSLIEYVNAWAAEQGVFEATDAQA